MEQEKKGSIFGSVIIVLILLGLVVYYLVNKNQMAKVPVSENTSGMQTTDTQQTISDPQNTSADAELEAQIEGLDTSFEDMNVEDLDM
ncbi:MAG: hypothetical protein QG654_412 [Patescibacteria group bacterium]|jgi:hypothetical protein|nr:hypothetical protein [Patescibacteria group bacterium]